MKDQLTRLLVENRNLKAKMERDEPFEYAWDVLAEAVAGINKDHGFYDENPNKAEMIALMHSELSEALEGLRHKDPADSHCPEHRSSAVELADCVIRIMHYDARFNAGVAAALMAKVEYNRSRPYKHGKEF